ncbi:thioredoxin family protein [Pectinatus sottacetonis]|uniref:thioredoxin family protein n=1 Tax=Pectinatus sottacetonis TaxID=1002795 RepID=UPI0018C85269|nr:thioredoxin family protein [Pectinatus sottacetonis]
MEIKILGMGCAKCQQMYKAAEQAVKETGVKAEITKIEDIKKIMEYGVMTTPALVIDKKVVVAGKVLSKDEIKKILS